MFLEEIRSYLCPDQQNHNRYRTCYPHGIECLYCGRVVDAYDIILNASSPENPFLSANLAHSYSEWTGDINVPCRYLFKINCGKILPAYVETKLYRLLKGLKVLKCLNYPFFVEQQQQEKGYNNNNTNNNNIFKPPDKQFFKNLMNEYVTLIENIESNSKSINNNNTTTDKNNDEIEKLAVQFIIANMKSALQEKDLNIFDQYFNVFVPYVQSRQKELQHLFPVVQQPPPPNIIFPDNNDNNNKFVGNALYVEILKSDFIRNTFSKYCVSFDVAYVMTLSLCCEDDLNIVYNLVFDLGARLCNRYFYLNNDVESLNKTNKTITTFLKSNVSPRKNLYLYYLIRKFPDQVEECFSDEFIKKFGELDRLVKTRFDNLFSNNNDNEEDNEDKVSLYEYQQTFPYILFQGKDEEYYSFLVALAHYGTRKAGANNSSSSLTRISINNANVTPKGLISECRKIYRVIKSSISRIREIQQNFGGGDVYWTRDTLNLFLCTDPQFSKDLMKILGMLLEKKDDK